MGFFGPLNAATPFFFFVLAGGPASLFSFSHKAVYTYKTKVRTAIVSYKQIGYLIDIPLSPQELLASIAQQVRS
jgi:hypothetical protein